MRVYLSAMRVDAARLHRDESARGCQEIIGGATRVINNADCERHDGLLYSLAYIN